MLPVSLPPLTPQGTAVGSILWPVDSRFHQRVAGERTRNGFPGRACAQPLGSGLWALLRGAGSKSPPPRDPARAAQCLWLGRRPGRDHVSVLLLVTQQIEKSLSGHTLEGPACLSRVSPGHPAGPPQRPCWGLRSAVSTARPGALGPGMGGP